MPWFVKDGMAVHIEWSDLRVGQSRVGRQPIYGTLAGAVIHGGVNAVAFDGPCRTVTLYDTEKWLSEGLHVPVSSRIFYRIVATPGKLHHPPLHITDAIHTQSALLSAIL